VELTALPRPHSWIQGANRGKGKGWVMGEGRGKGGVGGIWMGGKRRAGEGGKGRDTTSYFAN